jgi:diguanylate cyclase (GGDEF)-like protein
MMSPPENDADIHSFIAPFSGLSKIPMILIVDDNFCNLQLLHAMFKDQYEVCMASSGMEALAFCKERQPDLILLDVIMPELGGYAVCQILKNNNLTKNIPVIFISAHSNPSEEALGLDVGGVDFINKPFHLRVIKARVRAHLALKYQADALRLMTLTDGLTGIGNRRNFDATLEAEWRYCQRNSQPIALIFADVDNFKLYNDFYGHDAGDICLRLIASTFKAGFTRPHDIVARFGGEEFVCLLPNTHLDGAETKAKQLEQDVRALAIVHEKSDVSNIITISLGVAVIFPKMENSISDLVTGADAQMYLAKHSGRAQVKALQLS